ncbi:MAG: hypothetical protein HOY78_47875 [Saccharothrix sp.]|nr:hypothetical protein [Saccharothrix sp.]
MPDFADEMARTTAELFSLPEFAHYADHQDSLSGRVRRQHAALEDRLRPLRVARAAERRRLELQRRTLRIARVLAVVLVAFAAATFALTWYFLPPTTRAEATWAVVMALVGMAMLSLAGLVHAISRGAFLFRSRAADRAEADYDRELRAAVTETVTTAINEELGPRGIVAFPTRAPRLVELDTSVITPSATVDYVRDFIAGHDSSAIGLAGTRGSGKSTVMRALRKDERLSRHVAVIPAPVKYDDGEFIRRLLSEVATLIAGRPATHQGKRVRRTRAAFSTAVGLVGLVIVLVRLLDVYWDNSKIDFYLAVGIGLLAFAATALLYTAVNAFASIDTEPRAADVRQARRIQHLLKWEVEHGATSKNTVKLWSVFEAADEDSVKHKSRTMSHADLVAELRDLLTLFAAGHRDDKLVICVDELDKLDKPESLVAVVNELKDLFHIQGVHFVVAVSTDALAAFEQRGLPARDAFDSAFDVIVRAEHLTLDESVAVVTARATGFAPLIAMFCHAWSGGLPRDLLRAARMAVELQRRSKAPLTMVDLVSHVVLHDLRHATTAAVRAAGSDDPDVTPLWELHTLLDAPGTEDDLEALVFQSEVGEVLRAKAVLGVRLIRLAATMSRFDTYWDDSSPKTTGLKALLGDVGAAMTRITGPRPMREAAVARATRRFDPAVVRASR